MHMNDRRSRKMKERPPRVVAREYHRRSVNPDLLSEAVNAVKQDGLSIRGAAERFGVSKSTLHRALQNSSYSDQDMVIIQTSPSSSPTLESPSEEYFGINDFEYALPCEIFE